MYEIIKNICKAKSWYFEYSRRDFANLFDGNEDDIDVSVINNPLIFLDPVVINSTFGEFGEVDTQSYSGSFLMLMSSDIDEEDYDTRYQTYIKPLIETALNDLLSTIKCAGAVTINNWSTVEVINMFDFNADGIIVNYVVTESK